MSKIKLLLDVVSDLRSLADSVQALVDVMTEGEPSEAASSLASVPSHPTASPEKPVTLEQVRSVLAEKSQDGFGVEVRALLEKNGAKKLSAIDPASFSTLLAEAEALGHG